MTVSEFIEWCNEHEIPGDLKLAVSAFGGLGAHGKVVEKASIGFDWDKGRLLLHPQIPLTIYQTQAQKQEAEFRRLALLKSLRGRAGRDC